MQESIGNGEGIVFCIGSLSRKEGRLPYAGKEGWLLGLEVISRFTTGE